jgi:hypothetical protein
VIPRLQSRPTPLTRLTAALAVLLVLALTAVSASPELHSRLHDHSSSPSAAHHEHGAPGQAEDGDEGCVVTLFAQGLVLALGLVVLFFTGAVRRTASFPQARRLALPAPDYLHLPPQAPPVGVS